MRKILIILGVLFGCGTKDALAPNETAAPFLGQWYLQSPIPQFLSATPGDTLALHAAGVEILEESPLYGHPWGYYADSTVRKVRVLENNQLVWRTVHDGWQYSTGEVQVRADTLRLEIMVGFNTGPFIFFIRPDGTLGRLDPATGLPTSEVWVRGWPFAASHPLKPFSSIPPKAGVKSLK